MTLLAVLALLLSALAVAPSRIWRLVLGRVHIRFAERVYGFEERVYPAAAAAAILIALVIGLLSN